MKREASCQCGLLRVVCTGEPVRVSVCHCLACQKRSGGPFGAQARFPEDLVEVEGRSKRWDRIADSGQPVEHNFCPECGSVVFYRSRPHRHLVAIPIGAFADPDFPSPSYSVYERRKHVWLDLTGDDLERSE